MDILNPRVTLDDFFRRARKAAYRVLMLDYDGTLAPFRTERDQAIPYPGVRERLTRLIASRGNRVIIISGRAIDDLIPLLGLEHLPEIWGAHGAQQYLPGAGRHQAELPEDTIMALDRVVAWAKRQGLERSIEKKPTGIAFHWRGHPPGSAETVRGRVMAAWSEKAPALGLEVHDFDGGVELRAAGISKADAVTTVLRDLPADAVVAYLGDDATDEDAFKALAGHGLRVLVKKNLSPTRADLRIDPPDELLAFLDRWPSPKQ